MLHSDDDFSLGVSFFNIPDRFGWPKLLDVFANRFDQPRYVSSEARVFWF